MDPDLEQLVREQRLLEAAELARRRGYAARASALFEQACEWQSASREALRAGEPARALELALRADDAALAEAAAEQVSASPSAAQAAANLAARGHFEWAARILEAIGRDLDAARAWESAGRMTRAAPLFERVGQPAEAARVLEVGLRREPGDAAAAVALGTLLLRYGRHAAGVRALQRVAPGAPERREALEHLVAALSRLGLTDAARENAEELAALGGPRPAAPPPESPVGPAGSARLFGRYEIVRPIASSPRARVVEGFDRPRGERVAIKTYVASAARDPRARAALALLEADVRAVGALGHPAIVPVRAVYERDVQAGATVVLAWMEGGALDARLAREPVAPDRAAEIARAVLEALAQAHRVGVLHRAVKPSSVLFDAAGAARLSDFGAAHAADASATITAGDLGVLAYLSPEQREGRNVTVQSDVYAAGVLLREMLVGRSDAADAPSRAHPRLDARHDALVARMTARAAEERPSDALEALELLASLPWPGPSRAAEAGAARANAIDGAVGELAGGPRVELVPDGASVDTWTGRRIHRVPLTEAALERARLFTRADHPGLQMVLRVDRGDGTLWLAACDPPPRRPLTPGEQARIDGALGALLAAGATRAAVDAARVGLQDGEVVLRLA